MKTIKETPTLKAMIARCVAGYKAAGKEPPTWGGEVSFAGLVHAALEALAEKLERAAAERGRDPKRRPR